MDGSVFTSPVDIEGATINSISVNLSNATGNFKGVIADTGEIILTNGITNSGTVSVDTRNWYVATYSTSPSLSNSTAYDLLYIADNAHTVWTDASGTECYDSTNSYTTPQNPTGCSNYNNKISIYATYTASAEKGTGGEDIIWIESD